MRTTIRERGRRGTPSRLALAFTLAVGAMACDDSSSIDAVLAPSAMGGSAGGTGSGARITLLEGTIGTLYGNPAQFIGQFK